jgi:hypothetical protein
MHPNNLDQAKALDFILGGNALFTVKSLQTEKRFTYKVLIDKHNPARLRVYFLNGKDNTNDYKEFGEVIIENSMPLYRPISVHTRDFPAAKAFDHIFLNLAIKLVMPGLEIWHEGRCCRCGRVLTVPESIMSGIGPECIFKQGRVVR